MRPNSRVIYGSCKRSADRLTLSNLVDHVEKLRSSRDAGLLEWAIWAPSYLFVSPVLSESVKQSLWAECTRKNVSAEDVHFLDFQTLLDDAPLSFL